MLVATVAEELERMLSAPGGQYLAYGPDWTALDSRETSDGSRLDNCIAQLCHCGVKAVQRARALARAARQAGRTTMPSAARARGRKRPLAAAGAEESSEHALALAPVAIGDATLEDLLGSLRELAGSGGSGVSAVRPAGVLGNFLPGSEAHATANGIAVLLGRLMVWGTVNAVP